jgi:hypothetical protein
VKSVQDIPQGLRQRWGLRLHQDQAFLGNGQFHFYVCLILPSGKRGLKPTERLGVFRPGYFWVFRSLFISFFTLLQSVALLINNYFPPQLLGYSTIL